MGILVLAAAREELGDLDGEVVGVGPVVSAVRTASLLETHKPDRVVLVGTAGVYNGVIPVGTAVASARLGMSWGVASLGFGYVPRPPAPIEADRELLGAVDLPAHNVLTVGAITTDPTLASRLSDGWEVEHMESFGVALACQEVGIPFLAVLGIANEVGPDAHVQWLTHRDAAQGAARNAIVPLLNAV